MRGVMKALGEEAKDFESWREALDEYNNRTRKTPSEEDIDDWLDAQANDYADRLSKEFGNKLSANPSLAARAMSVHFGRNIGDLVSELNGYLPEDDDDETTDF